MNTRLLAGAGGLLFLTATIAPNVLGHDDLWFSSGGTANRYPTPNNPSGVSGHFVGAASQGFAIGTSFSPADSLSGEAVKMCNGSTCDPFYPTDGLTMGPIRCDMEVAVDAYGDPDNEEWIDGDEGSGGTAADGTWDDGGLGGACHLASWFTQPFNPVGCLGGQTARGQNGVNDFWIAAACDWKTKEDTPNERVLLACLAYDARVATTYPDWVWWYPAFQGCDDDYVHCQLNPCNCAFDRYCDSIFSTLEDCLSVLDCRPPGHVDWCGPDGIPDAADFGYGSGNIDAAVFPAATGIVVAGNPVACWSAAEQAFVYTFDSVEVSADPLIDPDGPGPLPPVYDPLSPTVEVHPALAGELWTEF